MKLWWYSAGNILYALGSLGYLAINLANLINRQTVESQATYIVLIILAIVFIIDALFYTADWYEQRAIKERRELIGCILNIIGSVLYLIGATVFVNQQSSTNNFNNTTNIPAFVFNIAGMLAYLGESILDFFAPRVSKTTSKCSVEFFAHLLNLLGNISYLCAHIIQPIVSTIASFTTDSLNTIMNFIFIIIRPIQIGGDVIYTIDAVLYIIVWIKANEQMRKVGVAWLEKGNTTFNQIMKKKKAATTIENLPVVEDISKQTPEPIPPDVETLT